LVVLRGNDGSSRSALFGALRLARSPTSYVDGVRHPHAPNSRMEVQRLAKQQVMSRYLDLSIVQRP
jgi:hypothetical protein